MRGVRFPYEALRRVESWRPSGLQNHERPARFRHPVRGCSSTGERPVCTRHMGVRFTSPPLRWSLPGKRLPRYGSRDGCDPRGQLNARRSIMAMHLLCKREVRFNSDAGLHASIHDGRGSAFQAAPSGFDPRCSLYAAVREVRPWLAKSGVGVRISSAAPALYVRLTTLVARASAPWCMTSPKERDKAAHVGHHAYADRSDDPVVNCRCNRLDDGATPSRISSRRAQARWSGVEPV